MDLYGSVDLIDPDGSRRGPSTAPVAAPRKRKPGRKPKGSRVQPDETWKAQAVCVKRTHLFYGDPSHEKAEGKAARELKAKRICGGCPVRQQCLNYALTADERHGVWGGASAQERWEMQGHTSRYKGW